MKIFFYFLLIFLFSCDNDDDNDYVNSDFTVNVGSYYNPQHLEIELGQSVKWINSSGFHDVEITSGPIFLFRCLLWFLFNKVLIPSTN